MTFDFDAAFDNLREQLPESSYRMEHRREANGQEHIVIRPFIPSPDGRHYDPTTSLGVIRLAYYWRHYLSRHAKEPVLGINAGTSVATKLFMEHPLVRKALIAVWAEMDRQEVQS